MPDRIDYITVTEAAILLQTTEAAIRTAVSKGLIRYTRVFEATTTVNKQSVLEYKFLHLRKTNNAFPED